MLGLTVTEIEALGRHVRPGQSYQANRQQTLIALVGAVDVERGAERRAARLALGIQANQIFNDGNTRTAMACMYALLMVERGQLIRGPVYQAYGQVGHFGPAFVHNAVAATGSLAAWISGRLYGPGDMAAKWAVVLQDIVNVQHTVGNFIEVAKTPNNRNNPDVRAALFQKASWRNNHGY